jgi:hypothetical protein
MCKQGKIESAFFTAQPNLILWFAWEPSQQLSGAGLTVGPFSSSQVAVYWNHPVPTVHFTQPATQNRVGYRILSLAEVLEKQSTSSQRQAENG